MYDRPRTLSGSPINPPFGEGRWQDALRRMRSRIGRTEFVAWDDTAIGSKDTHCSWGMCSNDTEQWPDKDDHIFPDDFEARGRITPRYAVGGCPLDTRTGTDLEDVGGCFYACRVFERRDIGKKDRDEVIRLYDQVIAAREEKHGRLSAEDDDEPWRQD
jgi:hypothetical protein